MLENIDRKNYTAFMPSKEVKVNEWITHDMLIPDTMPDAIKIINVNVNPYIISKECSKDKLKITGKLNCYVMYKSSEEISMYRGINTTFTYSSVLNINGITDLSYINICPNIKSVIYSLPNERKIAIKAELQYNVISRNKCDIKLLNNFRKEDQMESNLIKQNINVFNLINSDNISSSEEILLQEENKDVFEILEVKSIIENTEYKQSFNKIMTKGDIVIDIMYMSKDKETIKNMKSVVTFSGMVELENLNDNSKLDLSYILKDLNLRLNEESITVEYEVDCRCIMYENIEIEYIDDFYSQSADISYDKKDEKVIRQISENIKNIDIKESINNFMTENFKVINYIPDCSDITVKQNENILTLDGNLKISMVIMNLETKELENKTIQIMVNDKIDINSNTNAITNISANNINIEANGFNLEIKCKLKVEMVYEEICNIHTIENIKDLETKVNLNSINIYMVKEGDTLWSIAKKYKTTVQNIVKTNNIDLGIILNSGQKLLVIR